MILSLRFPRACRHALVAAAVIGTALPYPPARAATGLALANQVLELDRATWQQAQAQSRAQGQAPLTVLVGSTHEGLRARKLRLRLDEMPVQEYEYAEPEWQALARGALHPAWQGTLAPGPHRLRVELYARGVDADPNDPRAIEWIDETITLSGDSVIEVQVTRQRFGGRSLQLVSHPAPAPQAMRAAAHFWQWSGRPYLAARLLSRHGLDAALRDQAMTQFLGTGDDELSELAQRAQRLDQAAQALAAGDAGPIRALAEEKSTSEAQWVVQDRANLLLGYHLLRTGHAVEARDALGQVRSPGQSGHAAMLGYGWSFLLEDAPTGQLPEHDDLHPPFALAASAPGDDAEAREKALRRALVPWTELIGADPLDLPAQEGALSVAWALDELQTGAQAHTYYQRSAERLDAARTQLAQAMEHVGSGAAAREFSQGQADERSGWGAWLSALPYRGGSGYLAHLLDDPGFVASLDRFRRAQLLDDVLAEAQSRLAPATASGTLGGQLQAARQGHDPDLTASRLDMERRALELLRERKARIERYLAYARFALARHYDSAPEPEFEILAEASP